MGPLSWIVIVKLVMITSSTSGHKSNCAPSGARDGVNIYEWNEVQFGRCKLPLDKPAIIQHSPLKKWAKSTKKRMINSVKREGRPVTVEYHSSDCSCFGARNEEMCGEYVRLFSSYKSSFEPLAGNRIESIWYEYEANHDATVKYSECIQRKILSVSLTAAMKKAKSISLKSARNASGHKVSAMSYPMTFKLDKEYRSNYMQYMKYKDISAFFDIFGMENGLEDILMMNNWVGSTAYVSTMHYDESNNIYFMMSGNKTFELSQPDLNNKFIIFPMFHVKAATAVYDAQYVQHTVHILQHEVFYLPSYWWHHVTNGDYNSFALNVWIENHATKKIESYQFPAHIRYKLSDTDAEWKQILYFIQTLYSRYMQMSDGMQANNAFLFRYFSKMYPVLNDVHKYHMLLSADEKYQDIKWMNWFIDWQNMLKCSAGQMQKDLVDEMLSTNENVLMCESETDFYHEEWRQIIEDLVEILSEIKEEQGEQVALIEMAEFMEKILYIVVDDVMFIPICVTLHYL